MRSHRVNPEASLTRTSPVVLVGSVVLLAAACAPTDPVAPSARIPTASFTKVGASCAVDIGSTEYPLPALHELEGWLGDAIDAPGSAMHCGLVRSLDAKMERIATALDRTPPNFDAACGASGALVNELTSLVNRGVLETPSFPPPFPGGPTDVLSAAGALNERWCAAARGDLEGPRS